MNKIKLIWLFLALILIISCSAKQIPLQSQLVTSKDFNSIYVLDEEISIQASNAKPTVLKSGTKWTRVGSINQGTVYRTKDQVVIVNSFNVHEGYIVINQDNVKGYYLPIEKTFVEVKSVPIKLSKKGIENEN